MSKFIVNSNSLSCAFKCNMWLCGYSEEATVGPPQIRMEILRTIYVHINGNGVWRTRYNNELYTLYDELYTVKVIKIGRLKWLGHLFRMQELDPCRNLLS